jgi:hypothetical protein
MLRHAFKEWAVVCRALAEGRQALILRKGGIAEDAGEFRLEQTRFWLYPTYVHQQRDGIKCEALPLLRQAEAERPPDGSVRLSHFAEVVGVYHLRDLTGALALDDLHVWSRETVQARFVYRRPGLFVLPVRVYRAPTVHKVPERPEYAGCRSWLELDRELSTDGATPMLDDATFRASLNTLDARLKSTTAV